MTAEEKADEIYVGFWYLTNDSRIAKQCALICVDEILWEIIKYADNSKEYVVENSQYWQEVKQEIEKL